MSDSLPAASLDVACLCAHWCGTCRDYAGVFAALRQALPEHHYHWIDIEDQAELAGDIDIQTFPTLLVARNGQVLFAGPVLPRPGEALRLLQVLQAHPDALAPDPGADHLALAQALALARVKKPD